MSQEARRDADIVENQQPNPLRLFRQEIPLAKERSDVFLKRVPLLRRPLSEYLDPDIQQIKQIKQIKFLLIGAPSRVIP